MVRSGMVGEIEVLPNAYECNMFQGEWDAQRKYTASTKKKKRYRLEADKKAQTFTHYKTIIVLTHCSSIYLSFAVFGVFSAITFASPLFYQLVFPYPKLKFILRRTSDCLSYNYCHLLTNGEIKWRMAEGLNRGEGEEGPNQTTHRCDTVKNVNILLNLFVY